ncbi:hypothetical protein [Candidatus Binatus sp.]|uniref:hypothetical protein n=1 Tax=Candidatus Binatus sp. TaxID=2811406 RepID=UPI003CC50CEA
MGKFSSIIKTGLCFAAASIAMTISTAFAIWFGNGGRPPFTIADAWIYFAEWPMVLIHGIDFYVWSGQAFLVNMIGWSFIGLVCGAWLYRRPDQIRRSPLV